MDGRKRDDAAPAKPPSEPPVRRTTTEPVSHPPSEPRPREAEQQDIPPQALDRETAERLLKKAAQAGKESTATESGVD